MKKIKKNLKWITIIVVMIMIIGGVLVRYSLENNKFNEISVEELELKEVSKEEPEKESLLNENEETIIGVEETNTVYVDIKGAVNKPGVYEIENDKRVIDVLELAGGLTENANTTMINLAKKIFNEMVIIIYTNDEVEKTNQKDTVVKIIEKECVCPEIKNDACLNQNKDEEDNKKEIEENDGKVNINTANLDELLTITGIGESKASAIIEYRKDVGGFKNIEEIMKVSGIGESLYEKIKNYITI